MMSTTGSSLVGTSHYVCVIKMLLKLLVALHYQ